MQDFDKLLLEQQELINSLSNYEIELGVISGKSKNREKSFKAVTNADLMFIHENGSPLRNIPKRPVLEMSLIEAKDKMIEETLDIIIDKIINDGWTQSDIELELNKLCIRIQTFARQIIYSNDGRLAPNSPAVAAKKKGNHPLFDTGQLARSIVCVLNKKN